VSGCGGEGDDTMIPGVHTTNSQERMLYDVRSRSIESVHEVRVCFDSPYTFTRGWLAGVHGAVGGRIHSAGGAQLGRARGRVAGQSDWDNFFPRGAQHFRHRSARDGTATTDVLVHLACCLPCELPLPGIVYPPDPQARPFSSIPSTKPRILRHGAQSRPQAALANSKCVIPSTFARHDG
jgi:hypothetical protein